MEQFWHQLSRFVSISDSPSHLSHWPVFCLSLMSWITELFIVHSGLNPMFLSIYLLRTKPRKDREKEEAEEEDGWGLANKGWFRIAVRVSFIPGPLSHAWSRLSCYLPVLLDARSRMRRFVPALLLETKPLPLAGCTHTHTHTHTHTLNRALYVCLFSELCPFLSTVWSLCLVSSLPYTLNSASAWSPGFCVAIISLIFAASCKIMYACTGWLCLCIWICAQVLLFVFHFPLQSLRFTQLSLVCRN